MRISKTIRVLALVMAMAAMLTAPAFGQTATTQTALSAAISDTTTTVFSLVSATGFTASSNTQTTFAYLNQELVQIRSVDTTNNTITVIRGRQGTASRHASGTIVTYGVTGAVSRTSGTTTGVFLTQDPIGSCTRGNQGYTIVVNVPTHTYFTCNSTSSLWVKANYTPGDGFDAVHNAGDAAYTATLLDRYIDYTTATAARTVTLPSVTNLYGKVLTISNYTSGTFQTITVAAPNGQLINGAASIVINHGSGAGTGNAVTLVSVGGAWRVENRCSYGTGAGC